MKNKIIMKILVENRADYLNAIDMFKKINNSSTCYAYLNFETAANIGKITKDNIEICKENIFLGIAYGIEHYKSEFLPDNSVILANNSSKLMSNNEEEYIFDLHISQNYN